MDNECRFIDLQATFVGFKRRPDPTLMATRSSHPIYEGDGQVAGTRRRSCLTGVASRCLSSSGNITMWVARRVDHRSDGHPKQHHGL